MSRREYWAARRRYCMLRETAAELVTLGYPEHAIPLTREADELGATDIPVEVTCLVCGKDAGITCRPDENFVGISLNGLCGPCNASTTADAERRIAEAGQ